MADKKKPSPPRPPDNKKTTTTDKSPRPNTREPFGGKKLYK